MSNFGVMYKCYKEKKAVEYSLQVLNALYPECPVYLSSDGGLDFSYLQSQYPHLKFEMGHDIRGWHLDQGGCTDIINQYREKEVHDKFYLTLMTMLERIKSSVEYCNKEHILFMEPDVLVRGKLNIPEGVHLLGQVPQPNIDPSAGWNAVLSQINGAKTVEGWSVPIIFSSDAFRKVYKFASENEDIVRRLLLSDVRMGIADDVWIPVLFGAVGVKQVHNPDCTECNRNPGWKTSGHPLLHEYREMYPAKGSENVGRHTNEH